MLNGDDITVIENLSYRIILQCITQMLSAFGIDFVALQIERYQCLIIVNMREMIKELVLPR